MKLYSMRNVIIATALFFSSANLTAFAGPFDKQNVSDVASISKFQKVYIAPIGVELDEKNVRRNIRDIRSDRPVSDRDRERRAAETYKHMVRAFGKNYEIVDAPGADVLTVETTITRMISTRPTLEDQRSLNIQIDFSSVYAGGADFKVRLSQGDTTFAEIEDRDQSTLNDGRPRVGIWQDYTRASTRFSSKLARYVRKL